MPAPARSRARSRSCSLFVGATIGLAGSASAGTDYDAPPQVVARTGYFTIAAATLQPASLRDSEPEMRWLVLSSGSDLSAQPLLAFADPTDDSYAGVPVWHSADSAYHGGVATADVNGDGYEDLVVAVVAGVSMRLSEGGVKAYLGGPDGPSREPAWIRRGFSATDVAVADIDANGTLDIVASSVWEPLVLSVKPEKLFWAPLGRSFTFPELVFEQPPDVLRPGTHAAEYPLPFGSLWHPSPEPVDLDLFPMKLHTVGPFDRVDRPGPMRGRIHVLLNRSGPGALDFTPSPTMPLAEPSVSIALADVDLDGWIDILAGGLGLWLVRGRPPDEHGPRFATAEHRPVATRFVSDVAVGPSVEGQLLVAASASCLSARFKKCVPANAGVLVGTPTALFAANGPLLGTGSELPGAVAWQDLLGDAHPELVVGLWTRDAGATIGGQAPFVYRGTARPGARFPVEEQPTQLSLPSDDLRGPGVMGGDLVLADLYERDKCATRHTERFDVHDAPRSAFTLSDGPVERVTCVAVGGVLPLVPCDRSTTVFTLDAERRTVVTKPVPPGSKVWVTYLREGTRDLVLANPDPFGPTVVWPHTSCPDGE